MTEGIIEPPTEEPKPLRLKTVELNSGESWDLRGRLDERDRSRAELDNAERGYKAAANAVSRLLAQVLQRMGVDPNTMHEWRVDVQNGAVCLVRDELPSDDE